MLFIYIWKLLKDFQCLFPKPWSLLVLFCKHSLKCKDDKLSMISKFEEFFKQNMTSLLSIPYESMQHTTVQILLSGQWIASCLVYCTDQVAEWFNVLQMKLEKKRSSSMDKIMSKLRSAQKRAQEMRSSVLVNQPHQVTRTSQKALSFRRTRQMGSLSGCFTCHAF